MGEALDHKTAFCGFFIFGKREKREAEMSWKRLWVRGMSNFLEQQTAKVVCTTNQGKEKRWKKTL